MQAHGFEFNDAQEPDTALIEYLSGLRGRIHNLSQEHMLADDGMQTILARRIQVGDAQAARELIRTNRPLINFVLTDYATERASEPELIMRAANSVMKAARFYDPYNHGSFATHAATTMVEDLQEIIPFQPAEDDDAVIDEEALQTLWDIAGEKPRIEKVEPPKEETLSSSKSSKPKARRRKAGQLTVSQIVKDVPEKPTKTTKPVRTPEATSLTPYYRGSLTSQRIKLLIKRHLEGDAIARDQLISGLLSFIPGYAKKHGKRYDTDNLIQAGALEVARLVDRYDPARGGDLRILARRRVVGAMIDEIRSEERSRGRSRIVQKVPEKNGNGVNGTPTQTGESTDPTRTYAYSVAKIIFSLDDDNVHFDPPDTTSLEDDVIDRLNNFALWEKVTKAMEQLTEEQREVIQLRHGFNGGRPLETWLELSVPLDLTETGARHRYLMALQRLKAILGQDIKEYELALDDA